MSTSTTPPLPTRKARKLRTKGEKVATAGSGLALKLSPARPSRRKKDGQGATAVTATPLGRIKARPVRRKKESAATTHFATVAASTSSAALSDSLARLTEIHRQREAFLRAWLKIEQAIGAQCRRMKPATGKVGPKGGRAFKSPESDALKKSIDKGKAPAEAAWLAPLIASRAALAAERERSEKEMIALAKALPVAPFVEETPGLGYLGLAQIVAEAGDLSTYKRPGLLFRRFGIGHFSHDGTTHAQVPGLAGDMAIAAGRSKRRSTTIYRIGDALTKSKGPRREGYLQFKANEQAKAKAEKIKILPQAKANAARKKGEMVLSVLQVDRRARRRMEQRLLIDLWVKWREALGIETLVPA